MRNRRLISLGGASPSATKYERMRSRSKQASVLAIRMMISSMIHLKNCGLHEVPKIDSLLSLLSKLFDPRHASAGMAIEAEG
jgi:hypothetical protein